jgi:CheY-like chemotaxis protein
MGFSILVVDDSPIARAAMRRIMERCVEGVSEIHEAGDGEEGLAVLERTRVDALLVDVNMPVMDGLEMVDRVRAIPNLAELPIIVVSAALGDKQVEELRGRGVRFLDKPFTLEEVRETLTDALWGPPGKGT